MSLWQSPAGGPAPQSWILDWNTCRDRRPVKYEGLVIAINNLRDNSAKSMNGPDDHRVVCSVSLVAEIRSSLSIYLTYVVWA